MWPPDFFSIISIIYAFNAIVIAVCAVILIAAVNANNLIITLIINAFKLALKDSIKI